MIAGQHVTPTLRLARPLGKGAMGSVWIADHLALHTQVAVKFMADAYARDPGLVERFRREATVAAQIKSPHVAQVFDHGVAANGAPYIVMELLEGETLKERIQRCGQLPLGELVRFVGQTAKALSRAHQLGMVHRDIKPENVFLLDVEGEPFVKVLDFGIAKQERGGEMGMTSTGSMLGTPFFMSPEQLLSSKHVNAQADLWALAVLTYQALTGELPFMGETLGALSVAVHAGVFKPPSALRPRLPAAVDAWMARALQRDASARFGSAKEMADALAAAAGMGEGTGWRGAVGSASDPGAMAPGLQDSAPGSRAVAHGVGSPAVAHGAGSQALGGSGASGRTYSGVAATSARSGARRVPIAMAAGVLVGVVLVAGGIVLVMRGGGRSGVTPSPEVTAAQASGPEAAAIPSAVASAASPAVAPAAESAALAATAAARSPQPSSLASTQQPVTANPPAALAASGKPVPAANEKPAPAVGGTSVPAASGKPVPAANGKPASTSTPPVKKKDDLGF